MKTRAYLVAAVLAALFTPGIQVLGQNIGSPGPLGYAAPPTAFGLGQVAIANTYAPVPAPGVPGVSVGDGAIAAAGAKGGKKGKSDCGPCFAVYGDFIYLRARDAEVAYAVPIDGPIAAPPTNFPIQISPVGVVDVDFQPGFRFGFRYNCDPCNALGAEYTFFEANTNNSVASVPQDVIRSIVSHPGTATAAQDFTQAVAQYHLSHDVVDLNYYSLISCSDRHQLTAVGGLRAMQHEQQLQVDFAGTGTETVMTDIDFYGAGARGGLEYDRYISCQCLLYAKGFGSLIPGEFRADYDQGQSYDTVVVDTGWKGGRLVTIWDLELGVSWLSKCGNYRLNAGYMFSAWTNMVQTDEWIAGVQRNNFIDMDSTMTYDGLVARIEARY